MRALWPLHGLGVFLKYPALWRGPFIALLIAWVLLLCAGVGVGWWWWPDALVDGWAWWLAISLAVGLGLAAMILTWILILPLAMALALEHVAREVQRRAGAPTAPDESIMSALAWGLRLLLRTLHIRLGWAGLAFVTSFFGPLGALVGAVGMAHIACIDSLDIALAVRGVPGRRRAEIMRAHRDDIVSGAIGGAVLNLALAATVVGWILWLPSLVSGAAMRVLTWEDAQPTLAVPPTPVAIPTTPT